jgi:hypothetical protein
MTPVFEFFLFLIVSNFGALMDARTEKLEVGRKDVKLRHVPRRDRGEGEPHGESIYRPRTRRLIHEGFVSRQLPAALDRYPHGFTGHVACPSRSILVRPIALLWFAHRARSMLGNAVGSLGVNVCQDGFAKIPSETGRLVFIESKPDD